MPVNIDAVALFHDHLCKKMDANKGTKIAGAQKEYTSRSPSRIEGKYKANIMEHIPISIVAVRAKYNL